MKSYIDFFETLKGELIGSLKFKNKFIRLWGTTTIDGIEVMNNKFMINPGFDTQKVKSFLQHIGALKQFNSSSFRGTTSYYFYLNSSKADTLSQANLDNIIASKINSYCNIGEKVIINLNFTSNLSTDYFNGFTKQQIFDFVNNDYDTMYNTLDNYAIGDTLLVSTVGTYILFDNNQHFSITMLDASITAHPYQVKLNQWDDTYITSYKVGISLKIQAIRNTNVIRTSNIIKHIVDEKNEFQRTKIQQLAESTSNESTSGSEWIKNRNEKTNDIWYKGRMKLSFLNNNAISNKERIKILISAIDTGYTLPKTKWWKKVLGPLLIVIAVVVAIFFPPAGGILMGIAINVGIATLVMTGLSVYWGKHGDPSAANYMGRWIKVGSIISAVAGITAIITNIARQAAIQSATAVATETAATTGTTSTVTATTFGQTVTVTATQGTTGITTSIAGSEVIATQTATVGLGDFVSAGWDSVYSGVSGSFQNAVSAGLKMVRFFTNMRFQSQAKDIQSEINSLTEQRDKSNQELEELNDKEVNIALDDIRWYTSPLNIQSQMYDVDYLYEGTRMNIGRPSFVTARGLNIISNDIYDINKI